MKRRIAGFSLLELAVIVLILGMITTLLVPFLQTRAQGQKKAQLHAQLERADWALTGYVMAHHRLPCPDTDGNGLENCESDAEVGTLPYKALGIADATARQIRYGVLRREAAASDPENVGEGIPLALPRTANLTKTTDRFFPLLALLDTANNVFFETQGGKTVLRAQAVLPTLETYGTTSSYDYGSNLIAPEANFPVTAENVTFSTVENPAFNTLDFCWSLRVAEDPLPSDINAHVHLDAAGGRRQIAYGLALPIAQNALDNPPPVSNLAFGSPQDTDDERVRAVTPGVLWSRLKCGEAMASIGHAQPNAASAAVVLYRALFDYEQVQEQSYALAKANFYSAVGSMVGTGSKIIFGIPTDGLKSAAKVIGMTPPESNWGKPVAAKLQISKTIFAGVIAVATQLPLTVLKLIMAYEKREMAGQRYIFVKGLRATAKTFAETLLDHSRCADRQGLYQGDDGSPSSNLDCKRHVWAIY